MYSPEEEKWVNKIIDLEQELERYKNIVDELEKHLKQRDNFLENRITLDKLKELKGE